MAGSALLPPEPVLSKIEGSGGWGGERNRDAAALSLSRVASTAARERSALLAGTYREVWDADATTRNPLLSLMLFR
ncbi:MAG: hypothetical protein ISS57_09480 [Anaerolineales bacterium]|nr:hypothetical protein [Anaerolineales bacterium]